MPAIWLTSLSQLLATILGGALVMTANYLAHRRERRVEEERQQERNSALFTAVFAVRNSVAEAMEELSDSASLKVAVTSFKTALFNIHTIIQKSPPDTQYVMSAVYGLSLSLGEVVALTELDEFSPDQLERRLGRLDDSIEFFDLVAAQDLTILTEEEVQEFAGDGYVAESFGEQDDSEPAHEAGQAGT